MSRKQTTTTTRVGFNWSMNEINRLHNEYELKEMDVYQIAEMHNRGVCGILHKLAEEGLISSSWNDARGYQHKSTEKKALEKAQVKTPVKTQVKTQVKAQERKQVSLMIDKTCDYTGCSDSESDEENDEEYTLDDARNDYDPFSYQDKIDFFKSILPACLSH